MSEIQLDTCEQVFCGHRFFWRFCLNGAKPGRDPVVLVHGLSMSSLYMLPTARPLVPHFAVYAPDLPGFGNSQKPRRPIPIPRLAACLLDWMSGMGIQRADMIGNSMGCQVITAAGLLAPERLHRAVMIGPTIDPAGRSYPAEIGRGAIAMLHEPFSLWGLILHDYFEAGLIRTLWTLDNLFDYKLEDHLPHLQAPTLIIRGEHDRIVPQQWAERCADLLPDGQLVVLPGAGHAANYDSGPRVAKLACEFFEAGC